VEDVVVVVGGSVAVVGGSVVVVGAMVVVGAVVVVVVVVVVGAGSRVVLLAGMMGTVGGAVVVVGGSVVVVAGAVVVVVGAGGAATVTVKVAVAVARDGSSIVYVIVAVPLKSVAGVKVMVGPLTLTNPAVAPPTARAPLTPTMEIGSPSGSRSFISTLKLALVLAAEVVLSFTAMGGRLAAMTRIVTVVVAVRPPTSRMVYRNDVVPLKPAVGVN
jgi:hypothetical protein